MSRRKIFDDYNVVYADSDLREVSIDPAPARAPIEVILTIGAEDTATPKVLQHFAHTFDFTVLSIPTILTNLLNNHDKDSEIPKAFGFLHPLALRQYMEHGWDVPALFLVPMLRYQIDEGVRNGRKRFLIVGFGDGEEMVRCLERFEKEVAIPAAVISFHGDIGGGVTDAQGAMEGYHKDILLPVRTGCEVSNMYESLLTAIYEKATGGRRPSPASSGTMMEED